MWMYIFACVYKSDCVHIMFLCMCMYVEVCLYICVHFCGEIRQQSKVELLGVKLKSFG